MFKYLKSYFVFVLFVVFLTACGESEMPQEKMSESEAQTNTTNESAEVKYLPSQVIYQEEIYKNWPYTEAPSTASPTETAQETEPSVSEPVASDKPYQVVDGAISANAVEGWKTYNGGGCGACHGKGGIGAVGPNLADSVTKKLSKEEFDNIVTNGKPGTMMRPHNTNKRVMDNLDNLYAYLVARGDDVLGPGNLIKLPLGK
jgi:mono/diheme cytochrome c family protein